ncbi:unnamed protein product [Closterium sp. NIES-53]
MHVLTSSCSAERIQSFVHPLGRIENKSSPLSQLHPRTPEGPSEEFQCLAAASPHLASVLLAPEGDPDALDIPTPRSYAEAIEGPYSSQWQAAMDAEMASWKSTGTYVDAVPPPEQELRWLTYLLTDLGEPPRSPPVLYVDNKAMLALCREHRLEHRTKHIALRYFLAREL